MFWSALGVVLSFNFHGTITAGPPLVKVHSQMLITIVSKDHLNRRCLLKLLNVCNIPSTFFSKKKHYLEPRGEKERKSLRPPRKKYKSS